MGVLIYVLPRGLEPLSLAALVPKTSAYTNSATGAYAKYTTNQPKSPAPAGLFNVTQLRAN